MEVISEEQVRTKFMRRLPSKDKLLFVFPDEDDVTVHDAADIALRLPIPSSSGGTARSSKQLKFYSSKLAQYIAELE